MRLRLKYLSTDTFISLNYPDYILEETFERLKKTLFPFPGTFKDGVYLVRHPKKRRDCYLVHKGVCYVYNERMFDHYLECLNADRYNARDREALEQFCKTKLATKQQRRLLHVLKHNAYVIQLERRSQLLMRGVINDTD